MFSLKGENLISSLALGEICGITDERVRQLEDKGIFESVTKNRKKMFDLVPSVTAYIEYVKNGTLTASEIMEDIAKQDYRYKKGRADKIELEVEELKGMMHRAEDVESITADMIATLRAGILALPGRLAVDTAEARTPAEASAVIKEAVDDLLNSMARFRYDPAEYRKRVRERAKWAAEDQAAEEPQEEKPKAAPKKPAAKRTTAKKTTKRKTTAKKASSKRPAASKKPATASKPRKT